MMTKKELKKISKQNTDKDKVIMKESKRLASLEKKKAKPKKKAVKKAKK